MVSGGRLLVPSGAGSGGGSVLAGWVTAWLTGDSVIPVTVQDATDNSSELPAL
jgi:hypothetical protein